MARWPANGSSNKIFQPEKAIGQPKFSPFELSLSGVDHCEVLSGEINVTLNDEGHIWTIIRYEPQCWHIEVPLALS